MLDEWGEPVDPTRRNTMMGGSNGNNRYSRNRNNNGFGGNGRLRQTGTFGR